MGTLIFNKTNFDALLVVCVNLLETLEKLLSHLSQLSLLTTRQHGFPPRQSSITNRNNVARATKKARGMLFNLKRSFAALTPSIFLPLYKTLIRPHLEYAIQASSPTLSRDYQALKSVQKLALKFVKGLGHVSYKTFKFRLDTQWQSLFPEFPLLPVPQYSLPYLFHPVVPHPMLLVQLFLVVYSNFHCSLDQ